MAIRFHLDENVHAAVADALRRRGIDVTTPSNSGLVGATDEQHLAFARKEGRIVVTHDADFLRLHAQDAEHAGIAFCHARKCTLGELIRALSALSISTTPEALVNKVEYL